MTMTIRQRHELILESFGTETFRWHTDAAVRRLGFSAFTDEAIEWIVRDMVGSYRRQQRYNRESRERIKARARA